MFSRILFSTVAAAVLVAGAPALAAEGSTQSAKHGDCCCSGAMTGTHADSQAAPGTEQKKAAPARDDAQQGAAVEDPFNQSWGG